MQNCQNEMRVMCTWKELVESLIAYPGSTSINQSQLLCPPVYKLGVLSIILAKRFSKKS